MRDGHELASVSAAWQDLLAALRAASAPTGDVAAAPSRALLAVCADLLSARGVLSWDHVPDMLRGGCVPSNVQVMVTPHHGRQFIRGPAASPTVASRTVIPPPPQMVKTGAQLRAPSDSRSPLKLGGMRPLVRVSSFEGGSASPRCPLVRVSSFESGSASPPRLARNWSADQVSLGEGCAAVPSLCLQGGAHGRPHQRLATVTSASRQTSEPLLSSRIRPQVKGPIVSVVPPMKAVTGPPVAKPPRIPRGFPRTNSRHLMAAAAGA